MSVMMSHQIDILPYAGFWHRVNYSDIADLGGLYDWWNKGSDYYHHRVKIGTDNNWKWFTLPVEYHTGYRQIDVKVKNDLLPRCYKQLEQVYGKSKNWNLYKDYLYTTFCECKYDKMWELNYKLLLWVRDILSIETPLCIPKDIGTKGTATEKILNQLLSYNSSVYYCGKGGVNYLDESLLNSHGIQVQWVEYVPPDNYKSVSILSLLMDFSAEEVRGMING